MAERPEKTRNLMWMCLLAVVVSTIGGVGARVFRLMIGGLHNLFFLGRFDPAYEPNTHTAQNPRGVGIIAVPVVGSLIVAWLVRTFAPEAKDP